MAKRSGGEDRFVAHERSLARQPLSPATRRSYKRSVRDYERFLDGSDLDYGDPLSDHDARDYAARDFKRYLLRSRKLKPASANLALAAVDHFNRFLGLGPAQVERERLPQLSPRALERDEQVKFLRAIERSNSARDRAIATLLFYTAIRVGECAALDTGDVAVSARKGLLTIRGGKGEHYREIPLNSQARAAIDGWLAERPKGGEEALFLNRDGARLSVRSIGSVISKLGAEAGLEISPHVLRHTCLTNLVRAGEDVVLVAEIAGHSRLDTTRRYTLPSASDRAAALERIEVEH